MSKQNMDSRTNEILKNIVSAPLVEPIEESMSAHDLKAIRATAANIVKVVTKGADDFHYGPLLNIVQEHAMIAATFVEAPKHMHDYVKFLFGRLNAWSKSLPSESFSMGRILVANTTLRLAAITAMLTVSKNTDTLMDTDLLASMFRQLMGTITAIANVDISLNTEEQPDGSTATTTATVERIRSWSAEFNIPDFTDPA